VIETQTIGIDHRPQNGPDKFGCHRHRKMTLLAPGSNAIDPVEKKSNWESSMKISPHTKKKKSRDQRRLTVFKTAHNN
jgi:hypothetical protein